MADRLRTWLSEGCLTCDNEEVEHAGGLQQFLFDFVPVLLLPVQHEGRDELEAVVDLSGKRPTR